VQLLREYHAALAGERRRESGEHAVSRLRYWISPGSDFSGKQDKTSVLALLPAIFDAAAGPTKLTYREITAQDDRVALVADSTMSLKSGGSYDQTYHWLFKFRDDKIVEILEYLDILQVWKTIGTPEQKAMATAVDRSQELTVAARLIAEATTPKTGKLLICCFPSRLPCPLISIRFFGGENAGALTRLSACGAATVL
jgi:uncharacterized protein